MDVKKILQDLKDRKITPEEAKKLMSDSRSTLPVEENAKNAEPIAIIGISGRFPGSDNMEQYWNNLKDGKDCICQIPETRWDMKKYYDPQIGKEGHIYCDRIGMLDRVENFDPMFFEITPTEAEEMDPQHRLFLQEAYKAFEDAGYSKRALNNQRCGVYLGIVDDDYSNLGEMSLSATGNSNAIGAARISYFLNLKGPAIAIDTACSSSMVGVHLAVNALSLGDIDMALVGGSCLYLTPESYMSMCATGMLSPEGKCKTFDNEADGFVPGEGVAALVLKRLSDAQKEHDHIYGCIIASGMNQDGKTNGITAPNLGSQQKLESTLYEQKNINPESISYAEFHGTGTKLGDPIELEALKGAFSEKTDKKNFCAIGSVKSNLGHTSATGGIAGIEKILLCMQHKELVPTINVNVPNEHFDFAKSPFYINQERKAWETKDGKPLRACINSFGFSGTNVHIVLEEYIRRNQMNKAVQGKSNIFTLSAKNLKQLKVYAKDILTFLDNDIKNEDDFFYTLQVGREALEARLAIVVSGISDLKEKLKQYIISGANESSCIFEGKLSHNQIKMKETTFLMKQKQGKANKAVNVSERTKLKLIELAKQWLDGEIIEWVNILYGGVVPYKMSLPTYPFEEEAYWLTKGKEKQAVSQIHPLVHSNISDFYKQCFQSDFIGKEFFLEDHVIQGNKVLPGAAIIEMARAAASLSLNQKVTGLKDIVWLNQVDYEECSGKVQILLYPEESEEVVSQASFEVTYKSGQQDICCTQGTVIYGADSDNSVKTEIIPLDEIRSRCSNNITKNEFYRRISSTGIQYGKSFQGIQELVYNNKEAVAEIVLSEYAKEPDLVINPAILDAAMQTVSILITTQGNNIYLPFAIDELQIFDTLPEKCIVYTNCAGTEKGKKFYVSICTTDGKVAAVLKGLYLKEIEVKSKKKVDEITYFIPEWQEKNIEKENKIEHPQKAVIIVTQDKTVVNSFTEEFTKRNKNDYFFLWNGKQQQFEKKNIFQGDISRLEDWNRILKSLISQGYKSVDFMFLKASPNEKVDTQTRISNGFDAVFQLSKTLITNRQTNNIKLIYFVNNRSMAIPEEQALAGMFRGIQTENKGFNFRVVEMPDKTKTEVYLDVFEQETRVLEPSCHVSYSNGIRMICNYAQRPLLREENKKEPKIKESGTYLITGGLGGVGYITASYVAKTENVNLILTGRSSLSKEKEEKLKALTVNGGKCEYLQADITNKEDVKRVITHINNKYGEINGVFHSAGIIKDSLLAKKTTEEAHSVLNAKIYGTKYLDEALGTQKIDFIILYSSIASALGNLGQVDYCYGNSYMDHFAITRNTLAKKGLRQGKTVSINWPLWKNGGMHIDAESQLWMKHSLGLVPIETEDGIKALETALQADVSQLMVFKGDVAKVTKVIENSKQLLVKEENTELKETEIHLETSKEEYKDKAIEYFSELISEKTKIKKEKLDVEASFGDYGIDSILILSITRSLEKTFGNLSKTIFFEYGCIRELAEYFLQNHTQTLIREIIGEQKQEKEKNITETEQKTEKPSIRIHKNVKKEEVCEDIAIIGLSGKYPMADNVDEFWENLVKGQDCIVEIPKERWDNDEYFDPNKNKLGTTYSKWGGFINDVDKFDPLFFNIPPVEAEFLDPQVRLYLESAWHAMEDAGYTRESLANEKVGVYIGVMYGMYQLLNGEIHNQIVPASSSYAGIANRVSYFFDFKGPSMAIDTMCSSSLTALHLACESLKSGETDVAFVGGVNLSIHPNKYLLLSFGKFASTDGKCRSFGKDGDGYVPGEGVGTVILKPLRKAVKDKDQIYGVIKGTAINAGGKTSGFTVPSPVAQSEVIRSAFSSANIAPESISYIETHGTGTSLGDPIEIDGLNKVFKDSNLKPQSCAIGALKSNIGHLEGASGLAGLTKVILQLKHHKLVPSLHSDVLNPYIDFASSPFYVQHKYEDWEERAYIKDGKEEKIRRAGVSCFGAGGSNGHVIIEEYKGTPNEQNKKESEKQLYVFSAKNAERLKEYVDLYISYFEQNETKTSCLKTLCGIFAEEAGIPITEIDSKLDFQEYGICLSKCTRFQNWLIQEKDLELDESAMNHISNIQSLADYIQKISGESQIVYTMCGRQIAYVLQVGREAMEERLAIVAENLEELVLKLKEWKNGNKNQASVFYGNIFDYKEKLKEILSKAQEIYSIEEMLQQNRLDELANLWTVGAKINWNIWYEKNCPEKISLPSYPFAKEHYWVSDVKPIEKRQIELEKIGPVLHRNISDIYGLKFASYFTGEEGFLEAHQVFGEKILPAAVCVEMVHAGVKSLVPSMNEEEFIALKNVVWINPAKVSENGLKIELKFDIIQEKEFRFQIYNGEKPEFIYCQGTAVICVQKDNSVYAIQELMKAFPTEAVEPESIYKHFEIQGIVYGTYMQGIEALYQGKEQVLAKLDAKESKKDRYFVNPVMLDSTLQSAAGFGTFNESKLVVESRNDTAELPFAVEQVEIYEPCKEHMWAYLVLEKNDANTSFKKMNIFMLDEKGHICIRILNMVFKKGKKEEKTSTSNTLFPNSCQVYIPKWKREDIVMRKDNELNLVRKQILFMAQESQWDIEEEENIWIYTVEKENNAEEYQNTVKTLLSCFKKIAELHKGEQVIVQVAICIENSALYEGLGGFLNSIHLENPNLIPQLIFLEKGMSKEEISRILHAEFCTGVIAQVSYKEGNRYIYTAEACDMSPFAGEQNETLWKDNGIYLITGGAGGLGILFAKHISSTVKHPVIILTGRSNKDAEKICKKEEIDLNNAIVKYMQCDICDISSVKSLAQNIREQYGKLTGVIHSAGITKDTLFMKKTEKELDEVFKPKIQGLVNLDCAFSDIKVDFWLLMSSSAGIKGNVGQTDYAAANGFLDAYAEQRNRTSKNGKMYSVNWPLWKDGGMQIDSKTKDGIQAATGMVPLNTENAFALLDAAVNQDIRHFIPLEGNQEQIKMWLNLKSSVEDKQEQEQEKVSQVIEEADERKIKLAFEEYLKKVLSEQINLPVSRIDARVPMEDYGLTSIMTMELTDTLEQKFGSLSKTLFFEYQSLRELADYFYKAHFEKVCEQIGFIKEKPKKEKIVPSSVFQPIASVKSEKNITVQEPKVHSTSKKETDGWDIAVIGLAGRYPMADNVEELWDNIKDGKDCISTIKNARWNHEKYYDKDKTKQDKTYAKWGGFLDNAECFDPLFFRISPMEAETIDPQERLFLQCVYHAMEDAGYTRWNLSPEEKYGLNSNVGVFVGVMYEDYQLYGAQAQERGLMYTLNGSEASIANRVSYTYGFHGPCMSVDSMCSSSLSALQLACKSILNGDCNMAVAGGVNLSLHPNKFLMLGQSRFLSTKGRCEAFGEGGDGYVPGEGVGAVILKPLHQAEADGDHIYGVIKSAAVNHCGKTNGYTVPNPKAQTGVILDAWEKAGISPRAVSYIEAHGTGTSLGDPIEITGITHAFDTVTYDKQFVQIGSVKANIGHCESAAGIAGLTKILMQMKYKQIAPSIHSQILNKNIKFEETPCVVPQSLMEWKRPEILENNEIKQYPRIAGLSAFGAGGTNAHVVVEEYIGNTRNTQTRKDIPLFLLSARTKQQLEQKAFDLLQWSERNSVELQKGIITLTDIAYTLLVGREVMDERAAFVAESIEEFKNMLSDIANGSYTNVYTGKVSKQNDILNVLDADDDVTELVERWMQKEKYDKIADMWVKGMEFHWQSYFAKEDYRRISLPLYPFKKDRYWKPDRDKIKQMDGKSSISVSSLHPLIQQNVSDFTQQKYKTVFHSGDRFLEDHKVNGIRTLPAVVYFEMVQEAFLDAVHKQEQRTEFFDVLWTKPCTFTDGEEKAIFVAFNPKSNSKAEFSVYSELNDAGAGKQEIYCTGTISLAPKEQAERLSVQRLWENMQQETAEKSQIYECFADLGLIYGVSQQSIQIIKKNDKSVLAKLHLPEFLTEEMKSYQLYPSIMDGALQAAIALGEQSPIFAQISNRQATGNASVPFMIKNLKVFNGCSADMWAILSADNENKERLNVSLCDEQGNVCVQFNQIWYKEIKAEQQKPSCVMLEPVECTLTEKHMQKEEYSYRTIFLAGVDETLSSQIEESVHWNECNVLYSKNRKSSLENYENDFAVIYQYIKERMTKQRSQKTLIQVVIGEQNDILFESVSGILKTIHQENPMFTGQCIVLQENWKKTIEALKEAEYYVHFPIIFLGEEIKTITYKENKTLTNPISDKVWKNNGVYCITGGFGGIGKIFAKEIAGQAKDVKIALVTRGNFDTKKKAYLEELESLGAECRYYQADVTNRESVTNLIASILKDFGRLDGILHCAGIVKDNFIIRKSIEEWKEVLAPKLAGTWYLDEACKDLNLDIFALFSSFTAVTGNVGQADYALANSFLDNFAVYRNRLVAGGKRFGKTISINWPFWKEGGIALDDNFIAAMKKKSGMTPLDKETGMKAFYSAYSMSLERVVPLTGDTERIKALFQMEQVDKKDNNRKRDISTGVPYNVEEELKEYLFKVFSELLLLDRDNIKEGTIFEELGIDSIFVMKITERLEKDFGALPKTLLFECQTIKSLGEYLIQEYANKVEELFHKEKQVTVQEEKVIKETSAARVEEISSTRFVNQEKSIAVTEVEEKDEIAIIGMAGSYAQSEDLHSLWENLKAGKDCITEIPKDRWDYELYYNPDKDNPGTSYAKWGGFLNKVDEFDPLFFNISPSYAEIMDPQERIFLETAYHAVEDAGYTKKSLGYQPGGTVKRNVGVFVGVMNEEYQLYAAEEQLKGHPIIVSNNTSSVANRVSYFFDFHGPSLTIDTMCSSSLVAVHLACQAIQNKDCEMAIAGGVNVMIHPNKYLTISQSKFASTNGKCMSFGKGGDGYVPGEGTGAFILKSKKQAILDGDHIYGIIKGTSVNHGGKTSGYTVPNPNAQAEVIRTVLNKSGVNARTVSYIEAHGTGTSLGDPIEIRALNKAFQTDTEDIGFCAIGSIKSNIGHCESASGVAAITKVLLQMKYKQLVPSIHSSELNPNISFEKSPFRVQRTLEEWKKPVIQDEYGTKEYPRIAGISSFGAGGTNAHIIIEEYEEAVPRSDVENKKAVIVLSSQTEPGLTRTVYNLKQHLEDNPNISLQDISYTLIKGRETFDMRLAFVADTVDSLKEKLQNYLEGNKSDVVTDSTNIDALVSEFMPSGNRISLPGYVFDNERYWIEQVEYNNLSEAKKLNIVTLTGKENYIKDHFIGDKNVLPGSAILELIRKKAEQTKAQSVSIMENVMWMHPVEVKEGEILDLQINFRENQNTEFEICCGRDIIATGKVDYGISEVPKIDITELKAIEQACTCTIERKDCYSYFESIGLASGLSFQVIDSIYANDREGYAVLSMPKDMNDKENCVISPAMLNGVFQSVIGILSYEQESKGMMLPFALERIELYKAFTTKCYAYIQKVQVSERIAKFSILVTDTSYEPICYLDNFTLKSIADTMTQNEEHRKETNSQGKYYYTEDWKRKENIGTQKGVFQGDCICVFGTTPLLGEEVRKYVDDMNVELIEVTYGTEWREENPGHFYIRCGEMEDFERLFLTLDERQKLPNKIIYSVDALNHEERMEKGIYALFNLSSALMNRKPKNKTELLFVYECNGNEIIPEYAGISGFAKAIQMENPMFCYKLIEIKKANTMDSIVYQTDSILNEFAYPEDMEVVLKGNIRMQKEIKKLN